MPHKDIILSRVLKEVEKEMLTKFLRNGLDISGFFFQDENDKKHFFTAYEDYLKLFADELSLQYVCEVAFNEENDVIVYINNKEVCRFYIVDDYKTLLCDSLYPLEDEVFVFVLTTFFEALRDLSAVIKQLAGVMQKATNLDHKVIPMKRQNGKYKKTETKTGDKGLPNSISRKIDKIKRIQKRINKQTEKKTIFDEEQ